MGGEAGYGIMNTGGPIFAKTLMRAGFFVFIYSEYPSLIRGGHNTMQVTASESPCDAVYLALDQLVALNAHTIVAHQAEVKNGGVILYDSNLIKFSDDGRIDNSRIPTLTGSHTVAAGRAQTSRRPDIAYVPIPLEDIATQNGGDKIMRNVAAVGGSIAIFEQKVPGATGLLALADQILADIFKKKGEAVISANQKVLEAGYNEIKKLK
ncbi:MAG: hypothetical protein A2445_02805 [Candidatus Jacksonbacteria bacterium RIFOXYC2_FULL_44_29]|nr:MAG: Pyruvate flavodoxin/ferredoxin oxidoreductase domain-containing protein [Parcubacteria group bacterium GW2011_GWC2_44_22]OGY75161.1 MAG: hypothetical protein A2240_00980 [Candidatus Jacksonbacteria bacterium RIFOXYA2_FULL_43_12]OGY77148.1 MAG: hypothetical protein A2445_02805 [Candidatus Jacksonbacteria bacterium RIFOXYC2_FULL_44_29]OGY77932.1 MAG: hypothetical protein A2295_00970 [Candidatus Jacksonbacteria bacterium RIFOXYB2_FULL_44_15]